MDRNRSVNFKTYAKKKKSNPTHSVWEEKRAMRVYYSPTRTAIYAVVVELTESTDDWQATCRSFVVLVDLIPEQENSEGNRIAN